MRCSSGLGLVGLALSASLSNAIELNVDDRDSILSASKIVANNIITFYNATANKPGAAPGLLPQPYYWWNAGTMFNSLIKYWALSGDDSVVDTITTGLLFQVGPDANYMPPNQSKSLGNDDQAAWGLAAMSAAEYGLPDPSENITWFGLADAVFQSQVARWDESSCGGGLKWQIFTFNNGYNYKNSMSQGSFASLAARLGRYTGNSTYGDWAQRSVEWTRTIGLINPMGQVYDGTDDTTNCSSLNHLQWTINSGFFLTTGAYSANATASDSATGRYWSELTQLVSSAASQVFTKNDTNIIYEVACEPNGNCNLDQTGFKGHYARSLATIRDMVPAGNNSNITAILRASANAAAAACVHGDGGTTCAQNWFKSNGKESEDEGAVNSNLNALEVFLANLPIGEIRMGNGTENGTGMGSSTSGGGSGNATASESQQSSGNDTGAASNLIVSTTLTVVGLFTALFVLA